MSAQAPANKTRLIVIYGGRSAEHEVSCVSALHVVRAVDPARYDVKVVGITTEGRWIEVPGEALDQAAGEVRALPSPDTIEVAGAKRSGPAGEDPDPGRADRSSGSFRSVLELAAEPPPSAEITRSGSETTTPSQGQVVVLPLLHGPMGEDGTVQGLLEVAGIPYCGAGVAGSAAAMDKGLTKSLLASAGIPQARYLLLREGEVDDLVSDRVATELGWPVFVKPANMGSSIGITRAAGEDELRAALDLAFRYDEFAVIEEAVAGARELEIGVLGWPELRTSVPGEIKPSHDFYDFADKYVDGAAGLEVPAQIPDEIAAEMSRLAITACRAVRVDSMARVDFFWEHPGRGLLINEINTIPGFTPISMYPQMWAASGVPYPQLVDELVDQAIRRAERRRRFDTRHT
ncbi:MAG TPA: D-alanine--D-alanine ligase family protein [Acidimicrobiales bacterium]|nr:D-alanine--D-alanine ligase family protein [Acidimicrobiales bacterium]